MSTGGQTITRIVHIGEYAREPNVAYKRIRAGGHSLPSAPAFIFGPCHAGLSRAIYGQTEQPELGCYILADALVAPTGIALCSGTAFFGEALNLPQEHVRIVVNRLRDMHLPTRFVAGPLLPLFGPADESYAQLVTDYLPRLWLAEQAGYRPANLRILVPANLPAPIEDVLSSLQISPENLIRYRHWEEVIRTDLLLQPTILRKHGRLSPAFADATRFWLDRTCPRDTGRPSDRLFLAGDEMTGNLLSTAAELGFRLLNTDKLDLSERAALFATASHIAGPVGPALHDMVLAPAGARIIAFHGQECPPGFLHGDVAAACGHSIGYVFADDAGIVDGEDMKRAEAVLF